VKAWEETEKPFRAQQDRSLLNNDRSIKLSIVDVRFGYLYY
jgi:hypothetical protein